MTASPSFHIALAEHPRGRPRHTVERLVAVVLAALLGLVLIPGLAPPPPPTEADMHSAWVEANAQAFSVDAAASVDQLGRDGYSASPGIATLAAGGTNYDWAKLVLLLGGWPMTEENVTVITRWMRQENYVDSWWNRNNPLNNGWGSGGGGGTGSYDSLVTAAENAAEALHSLPRYSEIVAAFARSAPTAETETAIWFSGWATGMYNNGTHWSYTPVPVVQAPADAW